MRLMHFFDFVLAAAAVTSVSAAPGGHGPSNERLQAGDFGSSSIQQFLTAVPVEYRDHEGDAKGTLKVQKRNERLSPAAQARLKRPSYVRMLAGELKRDYPEITDDFAQCMAVSDFFSMSVYSDIMPIVELASLSCIHFPDPASSPELTRPVRRKSTRSSTTESRCPRRRRCRNGGTNARGYGVGKHP